MSMLKSSADSFILAWNIRIVHPSFFLDGNVCDAMSVRQAAGLGSLFIRSHGVTRIPFRGLG
jgi:hypothetical protein